MDDLHATLAALSEWDPSWAAKYSKMARQPWESTVLPKKEIELISLALSAACTQLSVEGTKHHMRKALDAGATSEEILEVLKCASAPAIHSCSLGAPILLEEMKALKKSGSPKKDLPTPACDQMRKIGQWNPAWDPFFELAPDWTEQFFAMGAKLYTRGVLSPKLLELISIALDASFTHMYAPGVRRHIRAALTLGATPEEVMEVLKLCVTQGFQTFRMALPLLAEELAQASCPKEKSPSLQNRVEESNA